MRIFLSVVTIAVVLLAVAAFQTRDGVKLLPLVGIAGFLELLGIADYVAFAWAFTECTSTGIRTRVFLKQTDCPWAEVANVSVWQFNTAAKVRVTTVGGTRFTLGAPVVDILIHDPDFNSKAHRVQAYWWAARAGDLTDGRT